MTRSSPLRARVAPFLLCLALAVASPLSATADEPATNSNPKRRPALDPAYEPTAEELRAAVERGRGLARGEAPLAFERGNGLRILMTGHSWVNPGRETLPAIAAAAGYTGHRQRHHSRSKVEGTANAIWLHEFGRRAEGQPARPILLPAIVTGEWDVMTWGGHYSDKPSHYARWIELCLEHNPDMVFYIQDGWPRFDPRWQSSTPAQIRARISARHAKIQSEHVQQLYDALEARYPGKVRIIPAGPAVVDLLGQYLDGTLEDLNCISEGSQEGRRGIFSDGGHLSDESGIRHLIGYVYFGMLYKRSPATLEGYRPADIPPALDRKMREAAWRAIVSSPYAGVDDANADGIAD